MKPDSIPSDIEAENAIRILIEWLGDDPNRQHLVNTPKRVLAFYRTFFQGYNVSPENIIRNSIFPNENYKDMLLLSNIRFLSHCEHHIVPITGRVDIGYIPDKSIVGINSIIKLVNAFAQRLQLQERLTFEIADSLNKNLCPKGVAVLVNAKHSCVMCSKDSNKITLTTNHMTGVFETNFEYRKEFFFRVKCSDN